MQQVRFVGLQSDAYGPLRVRRRRDFQVGNGDAYLTPMYVSPMHPESFDPELAPYLNPWLMVSASGVRVAVQAADPAGG